MIAPTDTILSCVVNIPLLCLHVWNLRRHPTLAIAGTLASVAHLSRYAGLSPSLHTMTTCVEHIAQAEFLYALHSFMEDDLQPFLVYKSVIEFAVLTSATTNDSSFHYWLLVAYAIYIGCCCTSRFVYHMSYFFVIIPLLLVDSLRHLIHVCMFMWVRSAYELADIAVFIQQIRVPGGA